MRASILVAQSLVSLMFIGVSVMGRPNLPDSAEVLHFPTSVNGLIYCEGIHQVGELVFPTSNYGVLGGPLFMEYPTVDFFTGKRVFATEFPKGMQNQYCHVATLWIGGIVGEDTLVSFGADGWQSVREFRPFPDSTIIRRSTTSALASERDSAISELDFLSHFTDTFTVGVHHDYFDGRPHIPLHLSISERSYSWSTPGAKQFVLVDHTIENIGSATARDVYVGVYVDADVSGVRGDATAHVDDIAGSRYVRLLDPELIATGCDSQGDSVLVAWIADNDGDLHNEDYCTAVTGVVFMNGLNEATTMSFNWWVSSGTSTFDFGPRTRDHLRDFGTGGTGTPEGDRNKYFLLSNGERDYVQAFTYSIAPTDPSYEYPANRTAARVIARGGDTRYLLSCGPFELAPDGEVPLTYAYVAGADLHTDPNNLINLSEKPLEYMSNLDFSDFDKSVRAAVHAADIPGKDTDQDGYSGTFVLCSSDTIWLTGDGVMDFRPVDRCCIGGRGNVDGGGDDLVNLVDLSYLIVYFTSPPGSVELTCFDEANLDGLGRIDIHDLSLLINYLRITQPLANPASCH